MKTVNVILSTFNGEKYLTDRLDSIFNQDEIRLTITIRDDGSSDSTADIIKNYLKTNKENVFFITGKNIGVINSFWLLLEHESNNQADYIAFCDQDDVWEPRKIISAIKALESSKTDQPKLYYSSKKIVDKHLKITGFEKSKQHKDFHNVLVENYATGCTTVINQALRKVVLNSQKDNCIMHDWWILLTAYACGQIIVDESAHILYRQHENNVVGSTHKLGYWLKKISRIRSEHKGRIFTQARTFKNNFYPELHDADKIMLDRFIHSENSFFARLHLIFLCKGFKVSFSEKILFSIKYLAGFSG